MDKNHLEEVDTQRILEGMGYHLGTTIGYGTYSKVYVVFDVKKKSSKACKLINKKCAGAEFIKKFLPRELKIISKIEHPNIVNVYKIFEIDKIICILMDYCSTGDLLEYLRDRGPLSEDHTKYYFRQIVSAITYLHNINIAHRDLKCENVLITDDDTIKLGDFGFARICQVKDKKILSRTFCGSAAYAAPEILQGIPYDPKMFDIWAMGCVLYVMLTATMPFDDSNIQQMIKKQLNKSLISSSYCIKIKNSAELKSLLMQLLEPNIKMRPTIKQVAHSSWLQQNFFKKYTHFLKSVSGKSLP